jgi:hypothetical protein
MFSEIMDFDTLSPDECSAARPDIRPAVPAQGRGSAVNWSAAVLALSLGLSLALLACTPAPQPAARDAPGTTRITGTLLEKLDGPPYSYLRLKTEAGEIWAAVPVAYVDKEKPVTVLNGVALKNYSVGSTGRRFDVVYFGVLAQPPPRP